MSQTWEQYDLDRLRNAVAEITRSPNLRFLFRALLDDAGVLEPLPNLNALDTARAAGKQDVGHIMLAHFFAHNPALFPELILEDQHERRDRATNARARVDRNSRDPGEPVDGGSDTEYS